MKRVIAAVLLGAAVMMHSLPAKAAEWTGTVELKLDVGELPVTNGSVTLYPVGIPAEDGYRLLDCYGGGVIQREDLYSGTLVGWISELAQGGRELLLDVDGRAVFSRVEEGLYLVKQTQWMDGFYPFREFFVRMPDGGRWAQLVQPEIAPITQEVPQTGDSSMILAIFAMFSSGCGLIFCIILGNRKKRREKPDTAVK